MWYHVVRLFALIRCIDKNWLENFGIFIAFLL